MPWSLSTTGSRICFWLRDYDRIQALAVLLIYIQIGCALLGSLGALYNGVLLINLVVALFALVAIESSSQMLGRTYAILLACAILLDILWFILFSQTIWNITPEKNGDFFVFSLRLALWMQIVGFSIRSLSSLLWIQMYRLGVSCVDNTAYREEDFDGRNSFLNPSTHGMASQNSNSDDIIGGSIYDPAYYSSLFEDVKDTTSEGLRKTSFHDGGSASCPEASRLKSGIGSSFQGLRQSSVHDGETASSPEASRRKSWLSRSFRDPDVGSSLSDPLNDGFGSL